MLSAAEAIGRQKDVAGAAGLAFQAIDLASKALSDAIDGADPGGHRARMRRTRDLIEAQQSQLDFLWEIRQRDFYGDETPGAPRLLPTDAQVTEALALARDLLERIDAVLHGDDARRAP